MMRGVVAVSALRLGSPSGSGSWRWLWLSRGRIDRDVYLILFGGMLLFTAVIVLLDWLGRRQHRRNQGVNR